MSAPDVPAVAYDNDDELEQGADGLISACPRAERIRVPEGEVNDVTDY
jgi:hypothetical protein